jgi:hypothetical protein
MAEIDESASFDAQTMAEAIATGEQEAPQVDVSKDYERSKEYEASETDSTTNAKAAPQFELPKSQEVMPESNLSSSPESFQSMAAAVNPLSPKEVDADTDSSSDIDSFRSMAQEINPLP